MYIPAWFRIDDLVQLHSLMEQFSFATLVTQTADGTHASPFATHLPFVLEREQGEYGTLRAHMARANPQWKMFAEGGEALVIFQGPHAYISPSWYDTHPSVPTWNYAVVHAYGKPRLLNDDELRATLHDLTTFYESGFAQPWSMDGLTDDYVSGMQRGIVGLEMVVTRLEGKFKLSQNQSAENRAKVIAHLRDSDTPLDVATADWMARVSQKTGK
jgi:transcriptional regulator